MLHPCEGVAERGEACGKGTFRQTVPAQLVDATPPELEAAGKVQLRAS